MNIVLSDMAPNTSGFAAVDQPRMIYLCELAVDFASQVLDEGGSLIVKVFQGEGSDALRKQMQQTFRKVRSIK
ncbi:SAM-dependent methyltransferase, partial [Burkholderia mallei]|uniref:SAM-dependent methyltransferase n=1 Tax=Burkholderia mallei TaxID=13373 RepID=UPI0034D34CBC